MWLADDPMVRTIKIIFWAGVLSILGNQGASVCMGGGVVAFPGAVGQGASASGGRGGDVYHVTTLEDYHPARQQKIVGSLRHAIRSAEGPRTILFDVGGAIPLAAPLEILKDNLTIAGQTAPGTGITVWGYPLKVSKSSNIILRYLRIRAGDFHARVRDATKPHPFRGNDDLDPGIANAVTIQNGCDQILLDHLSTSWGMDETLSVTDCRNVTVQHCIIAESLNDSFHPKGPHGYGSLIRGCLTPQDQKAETGGYTFYGNLWAHHRARNPSIGGEQTLPPGQPENSRRQTDLNLINNVIYNWLDQATHRSNLGNVRINMVGNCYINGPAKSTKRIFKEGVAALTLIYQTGNWIDTDQDACHDGSLIASAKQIDASFQDFGEGDLLVSDNESPSTFFHCVKDHVVSAEEAYLAVIHSAGNSWSHDAIDQRIIHSVIQRTGSLINSQEEFRGSDGILPGIDDIPCIRRPDGFDTDRDGLPNEFESKRGLDPDDPSDGNGTELSVTSYTNLEVYLNSLVNHDPMAHSKQE
ncbi:MAG: hypothetical protein JW829_05775 [Pirellulales bacterium]|nr:hypothetical protein [Pirellulales bacterium]